MDRNDAGREERGEAEGTADVLPLRPRPIERFAIEIPPSAVPTLLYVERYEPEALEAVKALPGLLRIGADGKPAILRAIQEPGLLTRPTGLPLAGIGG